MIEKVKTNVPVFLFLIDNKDRVYLQRRFKTRFLDGYYEPPSGGMHDKEFPQEAVCREVLEETGVVVDPKDVELFHAFLNFNDKINPYLGLIFRTRIWKGVPAIAEPELCDDARFYALNELPDKLIPQARDALKGILTSQAITLSNYESLEGRLEEQRSDFV